MGRRRTLPSALVNSWLVTGVGEHTLIGPEILSLSRAKMMPTKERERKGESESKRGRE